MPIILEHVIFVLILTVEFVNKLEKQFNVKDVIMVGTLIKKLENVKNV